MSEPISNIHLFGGSFSALQTADNIADEIAVAPCDAKIVGVAINVHTVISTGGVDQTCDILVNGADSGVDCRFEDGLADESGVVMTVDSEVFVRAGDALQLRSNGEQVAATTADITWILRQ